MPTAGEIYQPSLSVLDADDDTTAVLTLLDPDDGTATVPTEPVNPAVRIDWVGQELRLIEPGEWRFFWTVTGGGAGKHTQILLVDPDPQAAPAGFSHATTGDLARHLGRTLPTGRRLLADATVEIDRITKTARYATDPQTGRATDPRIRRALAEATCELVGWWEETGTATGARALFTSASISGVSLGYGGAGAANPQADRVGPRVWSILLAAGLVNTGAVGVYG